MKRIRYSLRSMLILFALLSVCLGSLGFYARKSQLQRQMVAELESLGKGTAWVSYDTCLKWNSENGRYELDSSRTDKSGNLQLDGIRGWIHSKLGVDFIDHPVAVTIQYPHTEKLPRFTGELSELIHKLGIREIRVFKVHRELITSSNYSGVVFVPRNVVTPKELELVRAQFPNQIVNEADFNFASAR